MGVSGGFEVPSTGSKLDFTGTPYEGLEVTVDEAPLGLLMDIMQKYSAVTGGEVDVKEAGEALELMIERFAEVLEDWNATKKGVPVPPTMAGLRMLGPTFVMAVVGAWLTGTSQAPDGLGKDSANGGTSPEALAAMAQLSSALPSSSPQRLLSGCATDGTCCRRRCSPSLRTRCGCSTFTGWATGMRKTRKRRGVSSRWRITTSRCPSGLSMRRSPISMS